MLIRALLKQSNRSTVAFLVKNKIYPIHKSVKEVFELKSDEFTAFYEETLKAKKDAVDFNKDIELLPPVSENSFTVYCIGKNYLDHVNEVKGTGLGGSGVPETPIVFSKVSSSVTGPFDNIIIPDSDVSTQVDYEGELGIIIGKSGKNISKENAFSHIFGVTVVNDVTARDKQKKHIQWLLGKSLDSFCPIGPGITPFGQVSDSLAAGAAGLSVVTKVNQEIRQNGNTKDMIFDIPTLIQELSRGITLNVGDVIATGTPSGVGAGFNPPRYLKSGDVVSVEISQVGKIENKCT